MLEIRNLTKVYKTKGGEDVRALDDVSIKFEEKGLVFLLGKSGSGKSTLLNLAGGLDEPTSGEVIVMGKSSKDFSASDFDSYRNTFIGFVFQEYNVLNEFNVEENVALALELQGKMKNHDKVMQILEEVELAAFAKRKPNTLSGGQKQRIAIARALVKDPQIIMADEPTGALDSATGKQVFDTLKKLSETRLVLVVSHDREFAEIYGDRIVELKDGKIVSDVVKVKEAASPLSGSVMQIGEDTLTVRKGAVDQTTLEQIRSFLEGSTGDVLISRGEREVANFKRVNRIDEAGAKETFRETEEGKLDIKKYDGKETRFIRSRLPAGKAIRIGASGLKLKPFRLVLTIFLALVSFVMFGLFSTMMLYDPQTVLVESFLNSDYEYLTYRKQYHSRETYVWEDGTSSTSDRTDYAKFTPAEIAALGDGAFGVYGGDFSVNNLAPGETSSEYYNAAFYGFAILPEGHALRDSLTGKYPAAADEICVSSHVFDCAKNGKFYPLDGDGTPTRVEKKITTEQDLIGEKILVGDTVLKITGVFESGAIPAEYDELKNGENNGYGFSELGWRFRNYLEESLHAIAFATDGIADLLSLNSGSTQYIEHFRYCNIYYHGYLSREDYESNSPVLNFSSVAVFGADPETQLPAYFFGDTEKSVLGEDELIVPYDIVRSYVDSKYWREQSELYEARDQGMPKSEDYPSDDDYQQAYQAWSDEWEATLAAFEEAHEKVNDAFRILNGGKYDGETMLKPTAADIREAAKLICDTVEQPFTLILTGENSRFGTMAEDVGDYQIVGFYHYADTYENGVYGSQAFYDRSDVSKNGYQHTTESKYVEEADATFSHAFAPLAKSEPQLREALAKIDVADPDTDISYTLVNELYSNVEFVNEMVDSISLVFLIAGLVLMVFSALLLFNFITMSITNKKREIGILRAVGARGIDVFKIFFSESSIIVGICTVLALIGTFALALFLNGYLKSEAGLQVTLFVFGPLSVAIMIGVALVVAFLGTFLPVYLASRKKPVESIRAL